MGSLFMNLCTRNSLWCLRSKQTADEYRERKYVIRTNWTYNAFSYQSFWSWIKLKKFIWNNTTFSKIKIIFFLSQDSLFKCVNITSGWLLIDASRRPRFDNCSICIVVFCRAKFIFRFAYVWIKWRSCSPFIKWKSMTKTDIKT